MHKCMRVHIHGEEKGQFETKIQSYCKSMHTCCVLCVARGTTGVRKVNESHSVFNTRGKVQTYIRGKVWSIEAGKECCESYGISAIVSVSDYGRLTNQPNL